MHLVYLFQWEGQKCPSKIWKTMKERNKQKIKIEKDKGRNVQI